MQPSKILLKAVKGVTSDFSNEDLPEGYAIESLNGRFLPSRDGSFVTWISVKGEKVLSLTGAWVSTFRISQLHEFDGNIIVFLYTSNATNTYIGKLIPTYSNDGTIDSFELVLLVSDAMNIHLNILAGTPIRKIKIIRETENDYTIYWLDSLSRLKSIRIINDLPSTDFANSSFSQKMKYGSIKFNGLVMGALPGAAMFYAYRLIGKNGAVTDWSMVVGPIMIPNKVYAGSTSFDKYSAIKYAKKGEKSATGISLTIENIDTSFYKIEVVAVVSSENSVVEKSYICHSAVINNQSSIIFSHLTEKNYGTILSEDIQISTQAVLSCTDFEILNNIMIVLSPVVDEALVEASVDDSIQFNLIKNVTIVTGNHNISFDSTPFVDSQPSSTLPPYGITMTEAIHQVSKFKNQTTGIDEKYSITASAGFNGYKNPIYETLMKNCWRGETYRIGFVPVNHYGKRLGVRHLGDFKIPDRNNIVGTTGIDIIEENAGIQLAKVVSLLVSNINISQWVHDGICDIQGFHIVVAPRDKQRLSEGPLYVSAEHTAANGREMSDYGVIMGNRYDIAPGTNTERKSKPIPGLYQYYSPDVQNNLIVPAEIGSKMKIEDQLYGVFTDLMPNAEVYPGGNINADFPLMGASDSFYAARYGKADNSSLYGLRVWNKYFHRLTSDLSGAWTLARDPSNKEECEIENAYDLDAFNGAIDHDSQAIYIDERARRKFINAYWGWMALSTVHQQTNSFGAGAACRLMVLNDSSVGATTSNPFATAFTDGVTIVSAMSNNLNLYGGINENALAKSSYRSCWHYQPIDAIILGKIRKSNGDYVFDNVEVFPGDCYTVPYSLNRLFHCFNFGIPSYADIDTFNDHYPSVAFVVPLQSNINYTMHDGDAWSQKRSFRWNNGPTVTAEYGTGIGIMKFPDYAAYGMVERMKYPQFADVVYAQNLYYALAENIFFTNSYPMRIFWSERKVDAEQIDGFRRFPFANYQSIQGDFGLPVALRATTDVVLMFTEQGIGYIPVDERSSIADDKGKALSIGRTEGVGQFKILDRTHGLMHRESLSQYGEDFTWYDFRNREWIFWAKGQQMVDLSQKFKFQKAFTSLINSNNLLDHVIPIKTCFLPDKEIAVYRSNNDLTKTRSFVFDYANGIYQGRRDIVIGENLFFSLIPIISHVDQLVIPGYGVQNKVNGNFVRTELTLVGNTDPNSKKIFDSFRMQGKNIEEIILTNDQFISRMSIAKIIGIDGRLNQYSIVENLDDLYVGEVPFTDQYDYLRGYCVVLKFKGLDTTNQVVFNSIILNIRRDIQ